MTTTRRRLAAIAISATAAALIAPTSMADAGVVQGALTASVPSTWTPQIQDNTVLDIADVGTGSAERIVVAGSFTQVKNSGHNGGALFSQPYVFSFNPTTGALDTAFRPVVNGVVNAVIGGPNNTVYIGGTFNTVNGVTAKKLAQLNLGTGALTSFKTGGIDGAVNDMAVLGNRLFLAGNFTTVGGAAHGGLATVDATTGAVDPYMSLNVAGHHNYTGLTGQAQAAVGAAKISITPDGSRMVVIGNFKTVGTYARDQLAMLLLPSTAGSTAAVDPNWNTTAYTAPCNSRAFDSYVRDVKFSPDGSYFALVDTGGPSGPICDTTTRWETNVQGQTLQPTWIDASGGDTTFAVEVTDVAVYVGGHVRWMNNTNGADSAGQGAVPRPSMAALDPRTGVPLAWNPGRNPRGVGIQALLATPAGLYIGGDTDYIGNRQYFAPKLAFLPLTGGYQPASDQLQPLPGNVVIGAPGLTGSNAVNRWYDGTAAATDSSVTSPSDLDWSKVHGAFLAGGNLFYGYPDTSTTWKLFKRSYNGSAFGTATALDPYNDPFWSTVPTGSVKCLQWQNGTCVSSTPIYYRGALPTFYTQLPSVTGMFYSNGLLYYTKSGSSSLFYRYFSVDSGIVGASEFTVPTTGFPTGASMFLSGTTLYLGTSTGLSSVQMANGAPVGAPTPVTGTGVTGRDWRGTAMFVAPGTAPAGANQPPTASFSGSCAQLVCSFDGTGSSDPDGTVASYAWNFGDGQTGTGPTPQHTYSSAGDKVVTLTVTDNQGATSQPAQQTVAAAAPPPASGIGLRGSAVADSGTKASFSVTVPASVQPGDGILVVLSTNLTSQAAAPTGYTQAATVSGSTNTAPTTQLFRRVAQAGDAGSTLTVNLGTTAKATLQLLAYSGTSTTNPVASVVTKADVGGTSHTTATATMSTPGWVVQVWSDKQANARTWAPPANVTTRSNIAGATNGGIGTLLVDSGAALPAGTVGGQTATVATASNYATMLTIVLANS